MTVLAGARLTAPTTEANVGGRIALNDRTVRALKPPSTGRLDVWDAHHPGFGLRSAEWLVDAT